MERAALEQEARVHDVLDRDALGDDGAVDGVHGMGAGEHELDVLEHDRGVLGVDPRDLGVEGHALERQGDTGLDAHGVARGGAQLATVADDGEVLVDHELVGERGATQVHRLAGLGHVDGVLHVEEAGRIALDLDATLRPPGRVGVRPVVARTTGQQQCGEEDQPHDDSWCPT